MLTKMDSLYTERYRANSRVVEIASTTDEELGPLKLLPGTWKNTDRLNGRGWNMIALPFAEEGGALDYRLLVNQFNEEIKFSLVDKRVPNRGIDIGEPGVRGDSTNTDQLVVTLDYEQMISQIAADDFPKSGLAGDPELAIHHEPGLFLHMGEPRIDGINIARLASIPHGNSALALGRFLTTDQPARIEDISGLPIGAFPAPPEGEEVDVEALLERAYLAPYKHFHDNRFEGLFDPVSPNALLNALPTNVANNTVLFLDTKLDRAGVHNIPFVERQADVSEMTATFWILELEGGEDEPELLLAYTQTVMLEFFPRRDGEPGLIKWPHVSINVMEKVEEATPEKPTMPGY
ncbi:heme-binding protein [Demequina mangrovi]|uniref:Uncharacterized protein n=1 Tax=Demequina mangrovi TaxID=1043493 RepID=A0A1H7B1N6_9MICO|nr:heme-binding protein [Demequina mangrovi]SEJ68312.1 hypothetical protein SAMN05421637_2673 [Demequina mangrovi]